MDVHEVVARKSNKFKAVIWNKDNPNEVLDFLRDEGIQFSFNEIASGGELILYIPNVSQVPNGSWILVTNTKPSIASWCHKDAFDDLFDIVGKLS